MSQLGELWKAASELQRAPFEEQAKKERDEFREEIKKNQEDFLTLMKKETPVKKKKKSWFGSSSKKKRRINWICGKRCCRSLGTPACSKSR